MCKNSVGIVSKKTILAHHPLVENVEEELKQLEKEEQEEQEKSQAYTKAFKVDNKKQDGGETNEED